MSNKKSWIKLLVIVLILTVAITYAAPWIVTEHTGTSSSNINLTFEGIGRGMDSKGNSFNINEIKSKEVLTEALKDAKMSDELTIGQFRRLITIKPIVGREALNKLTYITAVTGKTEDVGEKVSYPSQFVIGVKDVGIPSYKSTQKLEKSLTKAYFNYLESKYLVNETSEPAYSEKELMELDYPEMMVDLNQQADALVRYSEGFVKSSPEFASEKTGITFADLNAKALVIRDTDVRNTTAVVNYYILTKDLKNRFIYEEVRLKRANLILSKAQGKDISTSQILNIYDNSDNFMFASGGIDTIGLEPSENKYYDELMSRYITSKNSTIEASYNVSDIQKNISKLNSPGLTPDEYATRVDQTVESAKSSYSDIDIIKKQIKELAKENYETNIASKMGTTKANYQINTWGGFIINFIILGVLAVLIGLGYTWIKKNGYKLNLLIKAGVAKIGK